MKKTLPFFVFLFIQLTGFCKIYTIENSGNTFSPDEITITVGDTVQFKLEIAHNAVEVSQSTWDANGATSLAGGFSVAKGGGTVLPAKLTVGTHYYVCVPHASMGMKGKIIVKDVNGINENRSSGGISIFPTPAIDFITVKGSTKQGTLYSIISLDGKEVLSGRLDGMETEIFLRGITPGMYYFTAEGIERKAFTVMQP